MFGNYEYAIEHKSCCQRGCEIFYSSPMFYIMERNLFNKKALNQLDCNEGDEVYSPFDSYALIVRWRDFIASDYSMNIGISLAYDRAQHKEEYDIRTEINRTC